MYKGGPRAPRSRGRCWPRRAPSSSRATARATSTTTSRRASRPCAPSRLRTGSASMPRTSRRPSAMRSCGATEPSCSRTPTTMPSTRRSSAWPFGASSAPAAASWGSTRRAARSGSGLGSGRCSAARSHGIRRSSPSPSASWTASTRQPGCCRAGPGHGRTSCADAPVLRPVLDRHPVHEQPMDSAAPRLDRRAFWPHQLPERVLPRIGRKLRVEPRECVSQPALQDHLPVVSPFRPRQSPGRSPARARCTSPGLAATRGRQPRSRTRSWRSRCHPEASSTIASLNARKLLDVLRAQSMSGAAAARPASRPREPSRGAERAGARRRRSAGAVQGAVPSGTG